MRNTESELQKMILKILVNLKLMNHDINTVGYS